MADHICLVPPIKYLIYEEGEPTTTFKLATDMKPSISYLRVLFCPCVIRKSTAHVGKKATLAAPEHQENSRKLEVTWRTLRIIVHSLMVHTLNFGSLYSFRVNIYGRSYMPGTANQILDI